jgi:YidC/Oxa1 family membrane protein insertase
MEKRAILAIGLSVLVFIAFQLYQQKHMPRPVLNRPATETNSSGKEAPEPPERTPVAPVITSPSGSDTKASQLKVTVASGFYEGTIDSQGAVLTSWKLQKYTTAKGGIFEMIPERQNLETLYPGSMIFKDSALSKLANQEFYETTVNGATPSETSLAAPTTVVMKLKRGDLEIEKSFSFDKDNYLVDISVTATREGQPLNYDFFLGQDIGPAQEHVAASSSQLGYVFYQGGRSPNHESPPKGDGEEKKGQGVHWVGLEMQYFSEIAIPSRSLPYFTIEKVAPKAEKKQDRSLIKLTTPVEGSLQYKMYIGPKDKTNLEAVKAADITGVIDYGMFAIIVTPLLTCLKWIYGYVHNYGFAIIVLTLLLSLLLFPFRLKQMHSMKKMQVVQPKVKAIQDKYSRYKKTDPKRAEMNQEVMALYKEHGVNPLGGCLPLILQMPLLFAFYALLNKSIELRHAPFIWYIKDLSMPDPIYALPIIMGITMFVSQKMTPMTPGTDPTASKMMMIMPVVFTVMFFNVSSGLNLYFLCSNIFQIAFQKIAERWPGDGKSGAKAKP